LNLPSGSAATATRPTKGASTLKVLEPATATKTQKPTDPEPKVTAEPRNPDSSCASWSPAIPRRGNAGCTSTFQFISTGRPKFPSNDYRPESQKPTIDAAGENVELQSRLSPLDDHEGHPINSCDLPSIFPRSTTQQAPTVSWSLLPPPATAPPNPRARSNKQPAHRQPSAGFPSSSSMSRAIWLP
jgi:hypothetical protein